MSNQNPNYPYDQEGRPPSWRTEHFQQGRKSIQVSPRVALVPLTKGDMKRILMWTKEEICDLEGHERQGELSQYGEDDLRDLKALEARLQALEEKQ
jgi:hypothetical protein